MTEKRFNISIDNKNGVGLYDGDIQLLYFQFSNIEDATSCEDALIHQCGLMNELYEENQYLKSLKWNQDCINEISIGMQQRQLLEEENEQLKEELKEFKDFVYSDETILCYTCANCLSKGIYQIECSEKGKVDVHGTCFAYQKKEVK